VKCMGLRRLFLGAVALIVVALAMSSVSACNGGGGEIFDGTMMYQHYFLKDHRGITEPFDGIANIDVPYLPTEYTEGMDVVVIRNAYLNVIDITPDLRETRYLDYIDADIIPITPPEPPICDIMFGYMRFIDEADINACTYPANCLVTVKT